MICVEYAIYNQKYHDALDIYNSILLEQEALFSETQPKSFQYDQDKVQSTPSNPLEKYIEKKEEKKIDERLHGAEFLLQSRERLLNAKRDELIQSKNITDLIYRYNKIDGIKTSHIAEMMGYSTSQVYRILSKIEQKAKDATKCEQMRKTK